MTQEEYLNISKELQHLSKIIPLHWGEVQNNAMDAKVNMFEIHTMAELEEAIKELEEFDKNYFRRRWFLWQCSRVDEYLFYRNDNVVKNRNRKDKSWDIEFKKDPRLRFDIKGTVVPRDLSANFYPDKEKELIAYYYENQSKGVRFGLQNRLFIVHHSFRDRRRNIYLRCHWKLKEVAYKVFVEKVRLGLDFVPYKAAKSKCIFILESANNEFYFQIQ